MDTGWLGFSCRLESPVPGSVAAALASLFDRHEGLRCDFEPRDGGLGRRLLPPGAVEFEPVALGRCSSQEEAHDLVAAHLDSRARPEAWPRAGFVTVESDAGTELYAAFDPLVADVASVQAAGEELPLLHRAYAAGDAPHPSLALPASHLDHAADRARDLAAVDRDDPRLAPWRLLLADDATSGLPPASGVRRGDRLAGEVASMPLATVAETEELAALGARWGATLEQVFLALLVSAVAGQEFGRHPVRALLVDPGRDAALAHGIGWFARLGPLVLDVEAEDPLPCVVGSTVVAHQRAVAASRLPLPLVGELTGQHVVPALVLAFADRRAGAHRPHRDPDARLLLGPAPVGDQLHVWITCLPEGTFLQARHPGLPECGAWVATVSVGVRRGVLAALTPGAASRTPVRLRG